MCLPPVPGPLCRSDAVAAALRVSGIESGRHYNRAVHAHSAWRGSPPNRGPLPVAEAWAAEELSLPMHPELHHSEIERVADVVNGFSRPMAEAEQCHAERNLVLSDARTWAGLAV